MNKASSLYRAVWRAFESPWVFRLNQVVLDGGKVRPIRAFLQDVPNQSVVDIGCGPGSWVPLSRGRYLGIDESPSFIAHCRKRFGRRPATEFVLGDATRLVPEEPSDLALLISVLHHLDEDAAGRLIEWTALRARYLFVLDLYPMPDSWVSRRLYALDRGDFIRPPEAQEALVLRNPAYHLVKRGDFYSWNGLYRHTMMLFASRGQGGGYESYV